MSISEYNKTVANGGSNIIEEKYRKKWNNIKQQTNKTKGLHRHLET